MNQPNEQQQPNYVLATNENILVPKNEKLNALRFYFLLIIAVIIIGSLFFGENLFSELSLTAQILLVVIGIWVFNAGGKKRMPSPIELRFYDDFLVVHRPKRYYDRKTTRMEFNKFYYKDIERIVYKKDLHRMTIYGVFHAEWYDYDKNGNLPPQPTYARTVDSLVLFRTSAAPDVDFVAEIEEHSPIKVAVENH